MAAQAERRKGRLFSCDTAAVILLIAIAIYHLINAFGSTPWEDEGFYPTITYRLISGDSLLADEWHLSQFSSIFLYLPLKLYMSVVGSADGIILASRLLFTVIHFSVSLLIYRCLKSYRFAGIAAAALYLLYSPMGIMAVSYNSLCLTFFVLSVILLFYACNSKKAWVYIPAGALFAMSVINNPVLALMYFLYVIVFACACMARSFAAAYPVVKRNKTKRNSKLKDTFKRINPARNGFYGELLQKRSFLFITAGIAGAAAVAVIYFYCMGGSIANVFKVASAMFKDPEHNYFTEGGVSLFSLKQLITEFAKHYPWQMPVFIIVLLGAVIDRRKRLSGVWFAAGFAIFIIYFVHSLNFFDSDYAPTDRFHWLLGLLLFGTICFAAIKDKAAVDGLTAYFYIPGIVYSLCAYTSSNTGPIALNFGYAIANIAACIYIAALAREIIDSVKTAKVTLRTALRTAAVIAVCAVFSAQAVYMACVMFRADYVFAKDGSAVESGPLTGLYMSDENRKKRKIIMDDIDTIKSRADEDSRILITNNIPWAYLYSGMKVGAHTCWKSASYMEWLTEYYEMNPENIPDFVYVTAFSFPDYLYEMYNARQQAEMLCEYFGCEAEKTKGGYILETHGEINSNNPQ